MILVFENIRALVQVHPRTEIEKSLPSGGWCHWLERARVAGLINEKEATAWALLPTATLERIEKEIA